MRWCPMAIARRTCPCIGRNVSAAPTAQLGTGCMRCPSGRRICAQGSSCASPTAGTVPGMACACGPRMWITSGHTAETGPCSLTGLISNPCATPATVARRWRRWRKKNENFSAKLCPNRARLGAHAHARTRLWFLATLPPGSRSFHGRPADRARGAARHKVPTEVKSDGWKKTAHGAG